MQTSHVFVSEIVRNFLRDFTDFKWLLKFLSTSSVARSFQVLEAELFGSGLNLKNIIWKFRFRSDLKFSDIIWSEDFKLLCFSDSDLFPPIFRIWGKKLHVAHQYWFFIQKQELRTFLPWYLDLKYNHFNLQQFYLNSEFDNCQCSKQFVKTWSDLKLTSRNFVKPRL